jgi:hypothetical protein
VNIGKNNDLFRQYAPSVNLFAAQQKKKISRRRTIDIGHTALSQYAAQAMKFPAEV